MKNQGRIEVVYGPMFSGKSSELLRQVRRFQCKKKCFVINYEHDNRYSDEQMLLTHDKESTKAIKTSNLNSLIKEAEKYDVVAIDEAQFFSEIVQFCEQLANKGKIVLVAALDGTFQRKPFGNILNLLPVAEKVTKLSAMCQDCSAEAAFTLRTSKSLEIELIGGQELYKPVCRLCYNKNQESEKMRTQSGLIQTRQAQQKTNKCGSEEQISTQDEPKSNIESVEIREQQENFNQEENNDIKAKVEIKA